MLERMKRKYMQKAGASAYSLRIAAWLLLCVLGIALLGGCGEGAYTPDTLTIAMSQPFENSFNYFDAGSESNRMVIELVAGTLMREGADGEYEPYLGNITAEKKDGKLIASVSVKQGVRFSDGKYVKIDDLLFVYNLLADPGYTGCYADFWQSPIEGLAAYYWDDPSGEGTAAVPDFEALAKESYSPEVISEEDLKRYLRETSLEGEWGGNPTAYREGGRTWAQFIDDEGYGERLGEVMSSSSELLELLVDIYFEKFADRFDAADWYARTLRREYMKQTVADGVDVKSISGIQRKDDYTCTVTFTDPDADYIGILNRPLISSANYRFTNKGSGDAAVSSYTRSPLVGAGPYAFDGYEDKIVTLKKNRYFGEGTPGYDTIRLRYAEGELIPLNCSLRQFSCGFYLNDPEESDAAEIAALAGDYGVSSLRLRDGVLVYNTADADFSAIVSENGEGLGRHRIFSALWRVSAGK